MSFTFKPLWKKLIDLEMSKESLRKRLKISSSTLARMRKDEYIAMKILSDICKELKCTPNDVIEYIEDNQNKVSE